MSSRGVVPTRGIGRQSDWRATFVYGFAHFGKSLYWYASELLFAYYLTEITGLAGWTMGIVLAIGLTFSSLLDPLVGAFLSRPLSSVVGAARLQLLGSGLSSCALLALFLGYAVSPNWRLLYAILAGMAFRFAYAIYDLPQNALIALATDDAASRTRVTATRLIFSGIAALGVSATIGPLAMAQATPSGAGSSLVSLAVVFSVLAITSSAMLLIVLGSKESDVRLDRTRPSSQHRLPPECRLPLLLAFVMSISIPTFGKLQPYLTSYGPISSFWGAVIGCAIPVGSLASQPIWTVLSSRLDRSVLVQLSSVTVAAGGVIFWIAAPAHPGVCTFGALLVGAGSGGLAMEIWAAFGDAMTLAPGREGWGFGLLTGSFKLGLAAGGLALGLFLANADYRAKDSSVLPLAMTIVAVAGALACGVLTIGARRGHAAKPN